MNKDSDGSGASPLGRPRYPETIGRYRIVGVLGEGGMGTVYEAEQDQPLRRVALKIIRPGFVQPDLIRRFARESEVLGRLQHPGIAQIYEAGTFDDAHGPQPYFAMELVKGLSLSEYVRTHVPDLKARLELFTRICDAVNYAHQQGVIHRDLKPANIMVDDMGQPRVLDFGVARLTDVDVHATRQTSVGEVIGTLQYMSPEQVNAELDDVDVRSDVYSLGVILYELVSGKLPYNIARTLIYEAARVVMVEEPAPLSSINRDLKGDVEVIVAKALEKEKARRYSSANDLASDIRRYLTDEPISARPASAFYQLRKFTRRNRALVTGIATAMLMLAVGTAVSTWQALRARAAEQTAEAQRGEAITAGELAERRRAEAAAALHTADSARVVADAARTDATREKEAATMSAARATSEAAKAQAVNNFLETMLSSSNPSNALGKELTVRELLDQAAGRVGDGTFRNQPDVLAGIENTIGRTYFALGQYDQAIVHLDSAYVIRKRVGGSNSIEAAKSAVDLGEALKTNGDYANAAVRLTDAIAVMRKQLRPDDDHIASALGSLANVRYQQANNPEAERLFREALRLSRARHGAGSSEVADRLQQLGSFLVYTGQAEKGRSLLEESLSIYQHVYGQLHPKVVDALVSMSDAYLSLRKFPEAEMRLRTALPMAKTLFGESHPTIANVQSRLGAVLSNQGKVAEAEPLNRSALAMRIKLLGSAHPDVQLARVSLARVLQAEGNYDEADTLFTLALHGRRDLLGPASPAVASSLSDLAGLAKVRGQWKVAEQRYREAIPIWAAAHIVDQEINSLAEVGFALSKQDRFGEAEPILNDVLAKRRAWYGDRSFMVADAYEKLASVANGLGRTAEAESLSVASLGIRRLVFGAHSIQVAAQLPNVAFFREVQNDTSGAIPFYREALSIYAELRLHNDPNVLARQRLLAIDLCATGAIAEGDSLLRVAIANVSTSTLEAMPFRLQASRGFCLTRAKKFVEAEPLLITAEAGLRAMSSSAEAHRSLVVRWLVQLYEAWGKPESAAKWEAQLKTI